MVTNLRGRPFIVPVTRIDTASIDFVRVTGSGHSAYCAVAGVLLGSRKARTRRRPIAILGLAI